MEISVRYRGRHVLAAVCLAPLVAAGVVLRDPTFWLLAGFASACWAVNSLLVRDANRGLARRNNPEAEFLIQRVEAAIAAVP